MILVTDGAANCDQDAQTNFDLFEVYDAALPSLVAAAWTDDEIPTYVVGIAIPNQVLNDGIGGDPNNVNPTEVLADVAQAGGTGAFLNAQDQAELTAALQAVIDDVKTCEISLGGEPDAPELTKVFISGDEISKVVDCETENGWTYTNENGPYDSIDLCGTACDAIDQVGEADIEFNCN